MKLSLNCLKDYIDPKLSTDDLVERLTMAGLEVEGVESVAGDTVLEIEITPNRPDCLNILGLAREIGAITGKTVKFPKVKNHKTTSLKNLVRIEDKKDCSRYIATLVRDVRISEAPQEMKQRLKSLGIHAINNAVDITNFVLMETGQPLHAFDYDKLAGGVVIVRRARAGESVVTLDGVERKLDPSILVIADAEKAVAIAGIMGGRDTQITADTKNILLESAHFDMGLVRRACRTLGLRSDSSYRFERNVNFDGVLTGSNRAVELLLQLTGGRLAGRAQVKTKNVRISRKIKVKVLDIESLLGIKTAPQKIKVWLAKLGFKVTAKAGGLDVIVPGHRTDVQQDVDVIEEIARMIGFDHLPAKLPTIKTANIPVDKKPRELKEKIRQFLTAGAVDEIITLSMTNDEALAKSQVTDAPVRILNPLSQDQQSMRPSLLPSFLSVVLTNINRGQKNLRFFEIGKIYFKDKEKQALGVLLTGRRTFDWRCSKKDMVDVFDLKGLLVPIFQKTGRSPVYENRQMSSFDRICAAAILIDGKEIGFLGRINREVLNKWGIKNQDIYFAQIDLDEVLIQPARPVKYQPVSEFPAIIRDVSLAVKNEVPYRKIEEICRQQGAGVLKSVQFIEQYLGDKIPPGYKGIVFSCHYQSDTRTLREEEVSTIHERILQALIEGLEVIRR